MPTPENNIPASELHTDPGLTPALLDPLSSGGTSNILLNKPYTGNLPVEPTPSSLTIPPVVKTASNAQNNINPEDLFKFQKDYAKATPQILANSQDEYAYNKSYTYNPESENQSQNFNRYYQHWDFNKLGYKPWADNEALYREKGGALFGDVTRAVWAGMKLAGTGFMSPLRSFYDTLKGNALSLDYTSEKEMRQLNLEGSSTKGGIVGFTSNMFTNTGYTVGIMGEMVAEDLLLGFVAPETGGASAGLAVARSAKAVKNLASYFESVRGIQKAVEGLKSFDKAAAAYKALKGGAKFLNPFENTVDAIRAIQSSKNLTNLAKASRTAGAFYRDVRMANLTLSESKLEGASTAEDYKKDMIDKYYQENGKLPDMSTLLKINNLAEEAGDKALYWNIPTIFLTNKIIFPKFLNSFGKIEQIATKYGSKVSFVKGVGYEVAKEDLKTAFKALRSPKIYGKAAMSYFKGNFSEGLQESLQEVVSGASKDYYTRLFDNPSKQGVDYGLTDVFTNIGKQFSGQGFETFASGFFMGGLIGAGGKIYKGTKEQVVKYRDPERYAAYQKIKNKDAEERAKVLTEVYKNPLKYFGSGILNLSNQTISAQAQENAEKVGDQNSWQDWHDQSIVSHITTALETGTYGNFMEQLHEISKMDEKAIQDAYGVDGKDALANINKIQQRAEELKENYDYYTKKYPSPYTPENFKKDTPEWRTEVLGDLAWKHAVKDAIWFNHSFERNRQRIESVASDLLTQGTLESKSANEITPLYDLNSLRDKKKLLRTDISTLKQLTNSSSKKDLEFKKKQLKLLKNYEEALKYHFVGQTIEDKGTEGAEPPVDVSERIIKTAHDNFKNAYVQYLRHVSGRDKGFFLSRGKLDKSFEQVKDIHKLGINNVNLSGSINTLADPEGFYKYHEVVNKTLTDLYNSREEKIAESVAAVQSKMENNALLQTLFNRGFVVDVDSLAALDKEGKIPEEFYDVVAKQVVPVDDIRYAQFKDIVKEYLAARGQQEKPTTAEKQQIEKPFIQTATGAIRIIRHGETVEDEKGINSGPTQEHITPEGAKHVEDGAKENTEGLTKIVVSSRQRAKDSAEVIAKGKDIEIVENKDLDPWNTGDEKTGFAEIPDEDWHKLDKWFAVNPDAKVYAGEDAELLTKYADRKLVESFNGFKGRVLNALPKITDQLSDGGAIMTHSNVIQLLKAYVANGSQDNENVGKLFTENEPSKNGEVIEFQRKQVDPTFAPVKKETAAPATKPTPVHHLTKISQDRALIDIKSRLDKVSNGEELEKLEQDINAEISAGDYLSDGVEELIDARRRQLATTFNFEDIREGEILLLNDKKWGKVRVISKSNGKIKVRRLNEEVGGTLVIGKKDIHRDIKYKYSKGMKTVKPVELTEAEKKLNAQNIKNNEEFLSDPSMLKALQEEADREGAEKVNKDFFDNLGCK